ncbi:hypothetical protein UCDDA912_g02197 [Diaporthe ampelina]|uniref:Rhodanese domain-containing protein n=1 Tax=Diaporthe ampelina TaxID=1214573 RepID=A0A0G2FUB5_9PEZI|nr:hypothetical protein UCDDA912_g02197 [Diaporthe ampelina]
MTERFVSVDMGGNYPHSPKEMIKLYHNLYHLKNGLVAWKTQVERMLPSCDEFKSMPGGDVDIDPKVYLHRLIDDYETRIHDCEALLEGGSFSFQIAISYQSRHDAEVAIRDGAFKRVKEQVIARLAAQKR